jgi:signal transduction histidine kinase
MGELGTRCEFCGTLVCSTTAEEERGMAITDAPGYAPGRSGEDELGDRVLASANVHSLLHRLVTSLQQRIAVTVGLDFVGPWSIEAARYAVVEIVVAEAVMNAARHGHATSVCVSVDGARGRVAICDDGQGFNPMIRPPGSGLRRMRSLAESVDARFAVRSLRNEGTTIHLWFG